MLQRICRVTVSKLKWLGETHYVYEFVKDQTNQNIFCKYPGPRSVKCV
jgi:hypothetical protein